MIKQQAVKSLKVFMSLGNNKLYATAEDRANTAFDLDAKLHRIHKCLVKSKDYWSTEVDTTPVPINEYNEKYFAWLQEEYGLEISFQDTFGITGISGYKVLDEQKFLMFMLKFQ